MAGIIIDDLVILAFALPGEPFSFIAPTALALGWSLIFATPVYLVLVPCFYMIGKDIHTIFRAR